MLKASIDIGSNSVLLLISDFVDNSFSEVESRSRITALGKGLDENGCFQEKSMEATMKALTDFKKLIKKFDLTAEEVIVTATEAARVANNSKEFFAKVEKKLGFKVTIINSEGEAYYTALGVVTGSSLNDEIVTIMDIGGASTELIRVNTKSFKIEDTISLPVGSVRAFDWIESGCFQAKLEDIFKDYEIKKFKTQNLICVAGTMTAIGAMLLGLSNFKESSVNDSKVSFSKFCEFLESIKELSEDDLLKQYPFLGKRAKTITAGARVARAIGLEAEVENLNISTLGLRYGTLASDQLKSEFVVS